MFVRMAIVKATLQEQITVDMPSWNPVTGEEVAVTVQEMKDTLSEALQICDERTKETQLRALAAYGALQFFPVEYQAKLIEIIDVLSGKADPEIVFGRWKAAQEETAELERNRAEYSERSRVRELRCQQCGDVVAQVDPLTHMCDTCKGW